MSVANEYRTVKPIYRFPADHGLTLRALLSHARDHGLPVAVKRETVRGHVEHVTGFVRHVGLDTVRMRTQDGGETRIDLWRIDGAVLIEVAQEAA